jgi:hypothetical protein
VILDAGVLISVDRDEESARVLLTAVARSGTRLHTTHPVVAQVWRDGSRQARLAAFLNTVTVHALDDGPSTGRLLALSGSPDVVDGHLVLLAVRLQDDILTGDVDDLTRLGAPLGPAAPRIHPWP